MADWSNLSEELKRLGVRLGKDQPILKPSRKKTDRIEDLVEGRELDTIYGRVFSSNHTYSREYLHGKTPLFPYSDYKLLSEWAQAPSQADCEPSSFVFLDTETTGLSGGTGTMAFMIGAARFFGDELRTEQFFLRNPAEEKAQLAALSAFVDGASAIVSYNGKSFDLPIINTRFVLNRLSNPFINFEHFDLLHIARRVWRRRLKQCNLGNIEKEILGFYRTTEDIPGYLVPEFYRNYLLYGDGSQIAGIFYHNEIDVVSLAALFSKLAAILEDPSSERLPNEQDRLSMATLMEHMTRHELAAELYAASKLEDLSADEQIVALMARARLLKRANDLSEAIPLWEAALELGSIEAGVELAMAHEHHLREYDKAIFYVEKSLLCMQTMSRTETSNTQITHLHHRLTRLKNKNTRNYDNK